ncbi:hypothetical protein ACR6A7_18495 [Pantoea sp. RRHST58]|uniref:hypothetical protein n=1 Tax=Pantoea sp. RRHST58 TaxID=3425183 RepID=UPI003DA0F36E
MSVLLRFAVITLLVLFIGQVEVNMHLYQQLINNPLSGYAQCINKEKRVNYIYRLDIAFTCAMKRKKRGGQLGAGIKEEEATGARHKAKGQSKPKRCCV